MSREGAMITKLKEGLQEALVFLRQLGDFKIPAVMERRRKGLLDKLVELQGDTFRGDTVPKDSSRPSPEPSAAKMKSPEPKVKSPEPEKKEAEKKKEEEPAVRSTVTSPSRDSVTSPSKRLSRGDSKISSLVGNYEQITTLAKKEEQAETPKRFVQLKKVAKPSDFPDTEKGKEEEDEEPPKEQEKDELKPAAPKEVDKVTSLTPQPSPQMRRKGKENGGLKSDRPSSTVSEESATNEVAEEEEEGEGHDGGGGEKESSKKKGGKFKGIKKLGGKLGKKKRKGGRDKSPSRPMEDEEEKSGASETEEGEHKEEASSTPEHEEGVKISGTLEKKVTGRFKSSKWVKISVKLKDNVLYIGDKEKVELAGYMVAASDVGFDVVNHSTKKEIQFKTEEGENGKERWIEALNAAIEECTPEQEEPPATEEPPLADSSIEVPSITIEQPASASSASPTHGDTPTLKKKKEKAALGVSKPARKLPEQGVEMKGYMYRKKPGLGTRWEKTYCVLTFQAMYFTTVQDNTEYNHMLSLMGDAQKTLSEKKGHDKNSMGINLKLGSKKEQLSFDSSDFGQWKSALEKVLGIGGVEELLSEDEDIEDDLGEELYEELETDDFPPPIPNSPRPSTTPVPDDIIIDEDIYEDTDDYRQDFNIEESPVHSAPPPALPGRNPPKINAAPPPALPDRNPPKAPAPTLPPRNAPPKNSGPSLPPRGAKQDPQQYEQTPPTRPPSKLPAKAPAKAPAPAPDVVDEEIYDDVIPGGGDDQDAEIEETYDDVIVGENDIMEETYDDVVSATTSAPGQTKEPEPITEEFYEDMVPGGPGDGPQEDYVVMEPGEDIGGEELYVDVDTPIPARTTIAAASQPKAIEREAADNKGANSPRVKSGTFSRMFKTKPVSPLPDRKAGGGGQGHSGTMSHKAPKKNKFEERWAVVDGNFLIIYKNSSAKSHQEKLPLSECGLDMGSPDVGPSDHAFRITARGDRVHHFKVKAKLDFDKWVTIIKGLTKYAPIETVQRGEQQVYQALEDHIGESAGELTFKKGTYIRLISKDADNEWVGQIGNEAQVFEGKIGKFPMDKVSLAEDLYI